jgi:YebC/PmpR family DNA-binding regulatory protein
MSGHSKWSQIKHQKGASDAAKSRAFAKLGQFIALESKKAAGNMSSPGLVAAISRAKEANMPKDTIERAVAKGKSKDAGTLEQVVYEFYGPGGVAIIVDALTDNKNRTTQEMKHLITKNGFELGAQGSAAWAFSKSPNNTSSSSSLSPNEPLMDLSDDDAAKLEEILSIFDDQEDTQQLYTNARGYERMNED